MHRRYVSIVDNVWALKMREHVRGLGASAKNTCIDAVWALKMCKLVHGLGASVNN